VLAGELQFTIGDDRISARPGDLVHAPGGVPHVVAVSHGRRSRRCRPRDCPLAGQ
jgi:quercetin dioxygenase-like cupin family protein